MRFMVLGRRNRFWRAIAILWMIACISLLVHTLLLRNAPPRAFGDAEEVEELSMVILSFPASLVGFLPFRGLGPNYLENDPRSIVLGWLIFFVTGCLQWFVLVPVVVRWIRCKFQQ
jgi:hypothetical protein